MFSAKFRIVLPTLVFSIAGMIATVAGQCVEAPSDLVHWWTADGNAFDIIGGEHGTLVGGAIFGSGEVGQAFDLDGTVDGDAWHLVGIATPMNGGSPADRG